MELFALFFDPFDLDPDLGGHQVHLVMMPKIFFCEDLQKFFWTHSSIYHRLATIPAVTDRQTDTQTDGHAHLIEAKFFRIRLKNHKQRV